MLNPRQEVYEVLREQFLTVLGELPDDVTPGRTVQELGVSSLQATQVLAGTMRALGVRVPLATLRLDMTLEQIAVLLDPRAQLRAEAARAARASADPFAPTLEQFAGDGGRELTEVAAFADWRRVLSERRTYPFEVAHTAAQRPANTVRRDGEELPVLNFASYNYLGYGTHPDVIAAAKAALDRFGLGAAASPVIGGTLSVHEALEAALVEFLELPGRAISLFSSGYGANLGAVSALVRAGHVVVCDRAAHMSLLEGARLSGADIRYFEHNDPADLERVLAGCPDTRILVCLEGVYSADGDRGRLDELVPIAKRHGALVLVDEAHSMLLAGDGGRGVVEEQGVREQVDLVVMTFSKAFGGVGGAVYAREDVVHYLNWYARCRAFSCALDPAVTGGLVAVVELAASEEGRIRRARLRDNARSLRELLGERVDVGPSSSWIVPVLFGDERIAIPLADWLQRNGLDAGVLTYPRRGPGRGPAAAVRVLRAHPGPARTGGRHRAARRRSVRLREDRWLTRSPGTFDYNLEFLFELPLGRVAEHVPAPLQPAQARPGVGLVSVGFVHFEPGNLGVLPAFSEITFSLVVQPRDFGTARPAHCFYVHRIASDCAEFDDWAHRVDHMPVHRSGGLVAALDREALACTASDEDGPIFGLASSHPQPSYRRELVEVQVFSRLDGTLWRNRVHWFGDHASHQRDADERTWLRPHPFFAGIDVRGARCFQQLHTPPRARALLEFHTPEC